MPLVGSFQRDAAQARQASRYPLEWLLCEGCATAQLACSVPDPVVFNDDYSFATGTVPALRSHFAALAELVAERFRPGRLLEFGSNDGSFLCNAAARGVAVVGVDPATNVNRLARDKGLTIVDGFLDPRLATRLRDQHGAFDFVLGSNCFAHNESEHPVLEAVQHLLAPGGTLCLEVMYAVDVLESCQWDSLYHEHVFLYSMIALSNLLERHGLRIFDAERISTHAGSIRVFAGKDLARPQSERARDLIATEHALGLGAPATWLAFGASAAANIEKVRAALDALSRAKRIGGYGASGRAAMWANACDMHYLEYIVDASPLRHDRFLPGIGTPIVSPAAAQTRGMPDVMVIFAWNYHREIMRQAPSFKGDWLIPAPELALVPA